MLRALLTEVDTLAANDDLGIDNSTTLWAKRTRRATKDVIANVDRSPPREHHGTDDCDQYHNGNGNQNE